jgi:structural maintenance of chromosome 1
MDAISFVLGIKSSHLRSSQMKDLIYRGRIRQSRQAGAQEREGDAESEDADEEDEDIDKENIANGSSIRKCWVMAVYEDDDGTQINFKRS